MPIKTFRGLLADGAVDVISLHTNNGSVGYRIVKFQLMGNKPGVAHGEHTMKIYSVPQTVASIDALVDFSDNTLLGAAWFGTDKDYQRGVESIIFDKMIFNHDIYITHSETIGSEPGNYYMELEVMKLDLSESTEASLKDIRNLTAP